MLEKPKRLENGQWTVPGSPVESFTVTTEKDAITLSDAFKLMDDVHRGKAKGKDVAARFDAAKKTIARINKGKKSSATRKTAKKATKKSSSK